MGSWDTGFRNHGRCGCQFCVCPETLKSMCLWGGPKHLLPLSLSGFPFSHLLGLYMSLYMSLCVITRELSLSITCGHSSCPVIQSPCATCLSTPSGRAQREFEPRKLGRGGRVAETGYCSFSSFSGFVQHVLAQERGGDECFWDGILF